jgi:hypothetical protein
MAQPMANTLKPIKVTAETDFAKLLDDATKSPVLLEHDGALFRLGRADGDFADEDIAYEPDPALVRRMLAATAGSWADLDVDRVIEDLYEARRAGSRPPERP